MKKIALQILAAILFLAAQGRALAHAFLDHSEPKVGAIVGGSPAELKLWFTQSLEPAFSSVEVRDGSGREVDKKDAHLDDKDKSLLKVTLEHLSAGSYTVAWHVVSVDTHRTQGHFQFTVK